MSFSNPKTTAKTSTIAIAKRQSRSLPLGILMALFVCSAANAVNVQFKLSNFGFDPNAIQSVRLLPTNSTPTVQSNRIIINASITKFTDTNGNVTFTNVFGGSYLVFVSATNVGGGVASPTIFRITGLPTNSTSTVDASDYMSVAVPSDIARYLAAGTNIVFVTNSGTLTIHGTVAGSSGGGSLALSTNNTFLGSTGIVRLEFTNSATINTGVSYSNAGIAYLSFDLNPQATNAIGTNLLSWLNSNSNRTWVADNHFTNWTAAVSNLAQTKAVTNNPTTGGNFNHYGDMFVDGELEGNAVTVNQGALSLQYGTTDRVLGLFGNTMVSNTAVTISMLEGFSPADIGLTNLVATKIDTNNGTGFNLTVRSNSASAGAALLANGNVGINNPTPSAWLDISNMVGATIRALFHAGTNAQNGLTVSTNGNVGIGTNNPQAALHVLGAIRMAAANGASDQSSPTLSVLDANSLWLMNNSVARSAADTSASFWFAKGIGFGNAANSPDTFIRRIGAGYLDVTNFSASLNTLVVTNSTVGIGTNSPTRKLHIHAANGTNVMAVGGLSAGVPADTAAVSSWLPIEVNGTNFYLPLYK